MRKKQNPGISVVIPIYNEAGSIPQLAAEIIENLKPLKLRYEIIFIDDGSSDNSFDLIKKLSQKNSNIHGYSLRGNFGKSAALSVGFSKAKGKIIITMDGDLQDNPKEFPKFIQKINQGFDLVSGWKAVRHDPLTKTLPSRVINASVRMLFGLKLHDINCGFKAYRAEVTKDLNLYGDLYRFIPVFAYRKNFKIAEIPVRHRPRIHGKSKYGFKRFVSGFLDLLTVFFLARYLKRPGHFFGTIGGVLFLAGTVIGFYLVGLRLLTGSIQFHYPLLLLALMFIILGSQLIITGLIGEMIIYFQKREDYDSFVTRSTNRRF